MIKHGSPTGYEAHRHRGIPACDACRAANAERVRKQRARYRGRGRYPRRVHVDDVELLTSCGEHPDQIAARLGVQRMSLYRALHRKGRSDLVQRLSGLVAA